MIRTFDPLFDKRDFRHPASLFQPVNAGPSSSLRYLLDSKNKIKADSARMMNRIPLNKRVTAHASDRILSCSVTSYSFGTLKQYKSDPGLRLFYSGLNKNSL
jgi:hypothetical protein